jgi:primosomal protein N' (replication factor Y) (superfamily II helicase)
MKDVEPNADENERYLKLAVDAPLPSPLTYKTTGNFVRGDSVWVPLGKRKANAVILDDNIDKATPTTFKIKPITGRHEVRPPLPSVFLKWIEWLADYYVYPVGQISALAFPPLEVKTSNRKSTKSPVIKVVEQTKAPTLTDEQSVAVDAVARDQSCYNTHLLYGVTGSGKTEVYLQLLEKTLAAGQSGLVLVPEISLTPQLINRFAARFGEKIAVLHSHLTDRERTNQWWSVVDGEKQILIGARSALFCPIPNLGLIVVDEEHEPSYKQEEKLRYNARDAAIVLAKMLNIPIVLGSATPSLETWYNAQTGKYKFHTLHKRVADRALPSIETIDLRAARFERKENAATPAAKPVVTELPFWMTDRLYEELQKSMAAKEQAALFLNRRGVAQTVICPDCGHTAACPNCSISLTLHGQRDLVCHYCDYHERLAETCASCKEGEPKPIGIGTEQIESDIQRLFPTARVARADRDEVNSRESLDALITRMEQHEIDILIGTQMIAKGLDFPKLNLVGLVLADVGFNFPDFRATERSFQLLTQVSGRAGRHQAEGGRVILQTYNPEFPSIGFAKAGNFAAFADYELAARKDFKYPPFGRLAALRILDTDVNRASKTADLMAERAHSLKSKSEHYTQVEILGPAEAPFAKIRGKYRFHILLKSGPQPILGAFCRQLIGDGDWIPSSTKVQVDIDPLNLL